MGIELLQSFSSFKIFPNPTRSSFSIERDSNSSNIKMNLQLLNIFGEVVYSKILEANKNIVNFELAAGIYFVKIIDEESKMIKKLIVH